MIAEMSAGVRQEPLVLIVDKDTTHTEKLRTGLEPQGFRVLGTFLPQETENLVMVAKPNIVCIDPLDLSFGVKRLKEITSVPVIVLSRPRPLSDRLKAYKEGAELCLTKSASEGYEEGSNPDVLASFMRRILSRKEPASKKTLIPPFTLQYERGVIIEVLDAEKCAVFRYGDPLYIQPQQSSLLALLATEPGKIFTHQEILTKHRGPSYVIDTDTGSLLRMDICRLRNRLKPDDGLIQTAAGVGYYLLPQSEEFTLRESVLFNQENLVITESGRVKLEGDYVSLSNSQRRILMILVLNSGIDVPVDAFLGKGTANAKVVRKQVLNLRRQLGGGSKFIRNTDGGYRFD